MIPANVNDYRTLAKHRLPKFLFEYIDGGAFNEVTLNANFQDLQKITVRQRILRDVSSVELATSLLGQQFKMPIVLGPVGIAGLNARRGEVLAAQAAEEVGVPFCLSTVGTCSLEEVKNASKAPFWFQLYIAKDRGLMKELLQRATSYGCPTLMLTVDMQVPSSRYRDVRSGLSGGSLLRRQFARLSQAAIKPAWAWDVGICGRPHTLGNIEHILGKKAGIDEFWAWLKNNFDPTVTWKDLEFIREHWSGSLVVKGILEPDDARSALSAGADAVVVSNHGGRQLDGALSSIKALPAIADAVGNDLTVLMDGGIRSGLDVVRALALGAKGVLIGRPWVYALAARKKQGVKEVLQIFENEIRVTMALMGCTKIQELNRELLIEN